tara:strand:- start:154 stop:411 length:258 start_codon:yes stop_codon:yes gene_type:complete
MKITKRQLRKIIKEELQRLSEYGSRHGDSGERSTRGKSDEWKRWFQVGVEAGSHGGDGYASMPEDENYEAWVAGFDHAKSRGGSW